MRSWWSKFYARPLKDPLLDSYTLEELLYEYNDIISRKKAEEDLAKVENDKIEEEKYDQTLKWVEEQERLEAELAAQEDELAKKSEGNVEQIKNSHNQEKKSAIFDEGEFPEEIDTNFSDF
jgi:Glu-tRNA(Gln) amidotransferase subunit E-like FAD-binding protein